MYLSNKVKKRFYICQTKWVNIWQIPCLSYLGFSVDNNGIDLEKSSIGKEKSKYGCIVERNEAYCREDGSSQQIRLTLQKYFLTTKIENFLLLLRFREHLLETFFHFLFQLVQPFLKNCRRLRLLWWSPLLQIRQKERYWIFYRTTTAATSPFSSDLKPKTNYKIWKT